MKTTIKLTLFVLLLTISCKPYNKKIYFYKLTNQYDRGFAPTFDTYGWNWKDGLAFEVDSIEMRCKEDKKLFLKIIDNFKKEKKEASFIPIYAFILDYNGKNDTLYFREDFKIGYFINKNITITDTTKTLEKFLKQRYNYFFERDYIYYYNKFYPPNKDKN